MLALRCYRRRLPDPTILIKRWKSLISIRHKSTTDFKKRETIHLAINLLFPGLGDPQYKDRYKLVNKQINTVFPIGDIKETKDQRDSLTPEPDAEKKECDILKKTIDNNRNALANLNMQLDSPSVGDTIDTFMIYDNSNPRFELEDEFYNEVLELDKFTHIVELSPLLFCGNAYGIEKCAAILFDKECNIAIVQEQLSNLRQIGLQALKTYWQAYLGKDLKQDELNYSSLVTTTGLLKVLDNHARNVIKNTLHTELHFKRIFYQYLGALVVENGQLSPHFIHGLARFLENSKQPKRAHQYMNIPTPKQVNEIVTVTSNTQEITGKPVKWFQFAEYTIKLIGKRTELLQGHVVQRKNALLLVKNRFPELNEETNMANLGNLIAKDYKKYALDLLGFDEPKLSMDTKLRLASVFAASNFQLPVICNHTPKKMSPYQILPPVVNSNLINRILLLSKHIYFGTSSSGKFLKLTIRNFELFGHISYSYFIRLALERMHLTTLTNSQIKKLGDVIESHSFKSYIVDLMRYFENQKERLSYMRDIERLQEEQLLSFNQFNQLFACLSEEQKETWCHDLTTKVVTVVNQLDWQNIDDFLVELRSQLLKRKEYLNALPSSSGRRATSENLEQLESVSVSFSEMDSARYYNLAMEYLSYLNIKYHMNLPLGSYRQWLGLFEEKLLRTYGFDNVTLLGYLLDDIADETMGERIVRDLSTREEAMDKSFMGVQFNAKLKFRLDGPKETFWNYKLTQMSPPKFNLESNMNKFLIINHKIATEFFNKIGIKQEQIVEAIFKHGELGHRYYRYMILYFLIESRLSPSMQESVFTLLNDKMFKKKVNMAAGISNPFIGDLKMNHTYHSLIANFITSEYYDLHYHNQTFNQFISMQYANNKVELCKWLKGLVEPLIKQLEECNDEYDRQAVLFKFEQAYVR